MIIVVKPCVHVQRRNVQRFCIILLMTRFEKRRDKRLRRTYGRSLKWYNKQFKKQGGHCLCCPFVPKTDEGGLPLHVEHDHKLAKLKIYVVQIGEWWIAWTAEFTKVKKSRKKKKAIKLLRQWLRRKSVRGLVCWPCNSLIRKSYDNPDRMYKAAKMLDRHQKKMKWRKYAA